MGKISLKKLRRRRKYILLRGIKNIEIIMDVLETGALVVKFSELLSY